MTTWNKSGRFVASLLAAFAIVAAFAGDAEAGAKGGAFSGILLVDGAFSGSTTISFATNNTISYTEVFTGEPSETFGGEYTEIDLGLISFITMQALDASQNGLFDGSGLSLFSSLAVINYTNPDFTVDWTGVYFRTGSASTAPPVTTGGIAGR